MTLKELKDRLKNKPFMRPVVYIWKVIRHPRRFVRYVMARFFFGGMLKAKKDNEVYLLLGGAIGDNVYGLAYLDELRKKFPDKKITAFSTPLNSRILSTYREIDDVNLSDEVHENLCKLLHPGMPANVLWQYSAFNMFIPIPAFYSDVWKSSRKATLFNMRRIFNLTNDAEITYHNLPKMPVKAIKDFEHIKNRVVIIHPYPHYRQEYHEDIYGPICEELNRRSYIIFTNVIREQKPVKGTEALRCSIEELYSIACDVPLIVGGRGGILDLLIPSGINMFAIYESHSEFEFFPLYEWKSKGKIEEVKVKVSDEDSLKSFYERFRSFLDELKQEGRIS